MSSPKEVDDENDTKFGGDVPSSSAVFCDPQKGRHGSLSGCVAVKALRHPRRYAPVSLAASQAFALDAPPCHLVCTWPDVVLVNCPVRPPRTPLSGNGDRRFIENSRPLHGSNQAAQLYKLRGRSRCAFHASTLWHMNRPHLKFIVAVSAALRVHWRPKDSVASPGRGLSAKRKRVIPFCTTSMFSSSVGFTARLAAWKLKIGFVARIEKAHALMF